MPRRSSRGGIGKEDWSKYEKAWANILHKEIFETGRYFKKTEVSQFKTKNRRKKNRESPEEDEGFEEGISNKPYVKMVQLSSRDYLDQLQQLLTQLEDRVHIVSDDVTGLDGLEEKVTELSEQVNRLTKALDNLNVWGENQDEIELQLKELKSDTECIRCAFNDLEKDSKNELGHEPQQETADKLVNIGLRVEKALADLNEYTIEQGRAKDIRVEFNVAVENINIWITNLEAKIENRQSGISASKRNISEVQSDLNAIGEQYNKLMKNGKILTDNIENQQDKENILLTTKNLILKIAQLKKIVKNNKSSL